MDYNKKFFFKIFFYVFLHEHLFGISDGQEKL